MIPPGTAVRDAHACYEVVVPVTVPDKPRLAPCCLLLPLPPPLSYTSARKRTKFRYVELLEVTMYED
jgi:hypothetical protein